MFKFTRITSSLPGVVAKRFELVEGRLEKRTAGAISRGTIAVVEMPDLSAFGEEIERLGQNQALIYGLPMNPEASRIVTKTELIGSQLTDASVTARTKTDFHWPDGPGIMMLGIDGPKDGPELDLRTSLDRLRRIMPEFLETDLLYVPSSSSHICHAETGEDLTGLRGQRFYLVVADATDIERIAQVFVTRSWLANEGRFELSIAGSRLERHLIDLAVYQCNRIDFAAGASTGPGLVQARGNPQLLRGADPAPLDSRVRIAEPDEGMKAEAEARRRRAYNALQAEAEERRFFYLGHRTRGPLPFATAGAQPAPEDRETLIEALEKHVLAPTFRVVVEPPGQPGVRVVKTVEQILMELEIWDGALTLDPVEPGYDGGRLVGKLYLMSGRPTLFSFARGGASYRLSHPRREIRCSAGQTHLTTTAVLDWMRDSRLFFHHGGNLVMVQRGAATVVTEESLDYILGCNLDFLEEKRGRIAPVDPPLRTLRQVLAQDHARIFPEVVSISDVPGIRVDGSLLAAPGHDPETGVYLSVRRQDFDEVPRTPSEKDCRMALDSLLAPFRRFPVRGPDALSALLAAILTAIVRPFLPTAPMIVIDSPLRGTGKTLLATALGALTTGRHPSVLPPITANDDDEIRKRLLSAISPFVTGPLLFDNASGVQNSQALASFITAPLWSDRVLTKSQMSGRIHTRCLVVLNGLNLDIDGDLARRALVVRLDPGGEIDLLRSGEARLLDQILTHREKMVIAALTLIRAASLDVNDEPRTRLASFEVWDDLVRRTILWCKDRFMPGQLADPVLQVTEAVQSSGDASEGRQLLGRLYDIFGTEPFLAREVVDRAIGDRESGLADALSDLANGRGAISSKSVGRYLKGLRDSWMGNLMLTAHHDGRMMTWRIRERAVADHQASHAVAPLTTHPAQSPGQGSAYLS